jgi:hypothetical protein
MAKVKWKWFGHAAHLCVGPWCRFHLATQVGKYIVSTVGDYYPDESTRKVLGNPPIEIGYQRKYETMVFRAGPKCSEPDCKCGMPIPSDWSELEMAPYNTAGEATQGHYKMCEKWERR